MRRPVAVLKGAPSHVHGVPAYAEIAGAPLRVCFEAAAGEDGPPGRERHVAFPRERPYADHLTRVVLDQLPRRRPVMKDRAYAFEEC
jgi:hypothetical protein